MPYLQNRQLSLTIYLGLPLFERHLWLGKSQIVSFWSGLTQKRKKSSLESGMTRLYAVITRPAPLPIVQKRTAARLPPSAAVVGSTTTGAMRGVSFVLEGCKLPKRRKKLRKKSPNTKTGITHAYLFVQYSKTPLFLPLARYAPKRRVGTSQPRTRMLCDFCAFVR